MRRFIQLSYDGSPFCGWQVQPNVPSVQAEMERALSIVFGEPVTVVGAGRTDTGVNARHYIAHFDVSAWPDEEAVRLLRKLNAILPPAIVAEAFYAVADDAHARFDAVSRTYRYYIHTAKDPFIRHSCRCWYDFDVEAMNRAAEPLLGKHDFSSFEKTGGDNKTSLCTVTEAHWEAVDDTHLVFTITADRFLRNMVRPRSARFWKWEGAVRRPHGSRRYSPRRTVPRPDSPSSAKPSSSKTSGTRTL